MYTNEPMNEDKVYEKSDIYDSALKKLIRLMLGKELEENEDGGTGKRHILAGMAASLARNLLRVVDIAELVECSFEYCGFSCTVKKINLSEPEQLVVDQQNELLKTKSGVKH